MKKKSNRINKTTLSNGIRIVTKYMPYIRSVSMGIWVNVGARDESEKENGLSHFIEHMIFKGTEKRNAYQIAKEFDAIGGQMNAFTSMEHTCYHAKVLDSQLDVMVDILSDIFLNSQFSAEEIERERPVVCQEISMVEDSPEDLLHILNGNNFWRGHPLGQSILGTKENIEGFDSSLIKKFFKHNYHPERILISAAGNVDHHRFVDMISSGFESIKPEGVLKKRVPPLPNYQVALHEKTVEQTHICINANGLSALDPKRFAYTLLNTIIGGNMSSILFQRIREQEGLAYAIYSFIVTHADTGLFGIYTAVNPEDAVRAVSLILKEISDIKQSLRESSVLNDAKQFIKGNLYMADENPENQMFRIAQREFRFGSYASLEEVIHEIEIVTTEEILKLAADLVENKLSMTVLGPIDDEKSLQDLIYNR